MTDLFRKAQTKLKEAYENRTQEASGYSETVGGRAKTLEHRTMQILLAIFAIYSIALTPIFVALLFVQHPTATTGLSIQHTPVERAIAGSLVTIQAVVEGSAGDANVTLRYRFATRYRFTSNDWRIVQMLPTAQGGNIYAGQIPRTEPTEYVLLVDYQVCAKDGTNASLCTQIYTIMIVDFFLWCPSLPSIFHPNQTFSMDLGVQSLNGFDRPIDISISGLTTQKITATFQPSHVTPVPSGLVWTKLSVKVQDSAPAGDYHLTVTGKAGTLTRAFAWTVSIPDFRLVVTPPSVTLRRDDRATFNITLSSMYKFDSDIRVYLKGLPKGASYQLTASTFHLNGISILALSIETTSSAESGTYLITVSAMGGGRLNESTITLIIT